MKIQDGPCVAAFTNVKMSSPWPAENYNSKETTLFNLTTKTVFPCVQENIAVWCYSLYGPYFGDSELCALTSDETAL